MKTSAGKLEDIIKKEKTVVFTSEHKEKLRKARLGKKHSEETKKAISESVKKDWKFWKGGVG